MALAVPTMRTLNIEPTQNWQQTKLQRDMPMKRRMASKPPPLTTREIKKTAGANMSMTIALPKRGPRVSSTVPMKTRPKTAPQTAVTPANPASVLVRLKFSRMRGL